MMDEQIRFLICMDNGGYRASLEPLKVYMALPDGEPDLGLIRVVDESGEGYLYPDSAFMVVNVPSAKAEDLSKRLKLEAGKAPDAPADSVPDAVRQWLAEAEEFVEENEPVLDDPELDSVTNAHLATEATSRLTEVSGAINRARETKRFPSSQMLEMNKSFRRLLAFSKRVLEHFGEHFAEDREQPRSHEIKTSYDVVAEAERYVRPPM